MFQLTVKERRDKIQLARKKGAELRALRLSRGIQQKFVASQMGVSAGHLVDLEAGNRYWTPSKEAAFKKAIGL